MGVHVGCRPSGPWSDRTARGTGWLCLPHQGQGPQGQSGRSGAALSLAQQPIPVRPSPGVGARGPLPRPPLPLASSAACCVLQYCVRVSVCVWVSESCSSFSWLARAFFFFYRIPPPRASPSPPSPFPLSPHRESLTVSPPNRLVAESTDLLPSSPFLPSPLLYVLTTVTPLKSPLCAFLANSRSPFNPSGRPIYILSANAKIPPLLNPLHLALPCLCTNEESLGTRHSVSNDLNPLSLRLFNYSLLPTLHCAALPSIRLPYLQLVQDDTPYFVTCLCYFYTFLISLLPSRIPSLRTADPR